MTVTATAPGSPGNKIQVEVGPATNGNPAMVDVIVSEEDLYKGLTLTSLVAQLGTSTTRGTKPGLLLVKTPIPAGAAAPVANNGSVTFTDPTWTISGTGANALTLEPQRAGTGFDDADFKVSVSDVAVAGVGTFTLKVVWKKTLTNVTLTNVPLTDLAATLNTEFGYLVTFTAPAGSKPLQRGTVTLTGGNESVAATKAVANILAAG